MEPAAAKPRLGLILVVALAAFAVMALAVYLLGDGSSIFLVDGELALAPFVAAVVLVSGLIVAATWAVAHRQAQRSQQVQAQLAALVEGSEDAIIGADTKGNITSWNAGATRLYGYTAQETLGKPFTMLLPAGDEAAEPVMRERFAQVLAGVRLPSFQTRRRRKDGSVIDVSLTLSLIRDAEGKAAGLSAVARDITDEKRIEAELRRAKETAEEATRAKAQFLANMSHEIRTPLNAVIGMSGLLGQTELSSEQREYADTIRLSGDHLLTVINDILDFSKVESGRMELERTPMRLERIIEEALELVAVKAAEKGLELDRTVAPDVPDWVFGDTGRIRQVLVNLLSNAVRFTERGSVSVAATSTRSPDGRHLVHVRVQDTGIGIPRDRFDRLFKSFSQVDNSTTRLYGGTGLGLAISKQLVELMGGTIGAESEEGRGSTFHFTIPFDAAEAPPDAVESGALREVAGLRVLVVDDHPANRRLLQLVGERWGLEVTAMADPEAALAHVVASPPYGAAVLDRMMPVLDGETLVRKLRATTTGAKLPVIFLGSVHDPGVLRDDPLVLARLSKPLRQAQLLDALVAAARLGRGLPLQSAQTAAAARPMVPLRILLAEDNATNQRVALRMLEKLGQRADVVGNGREAVEALAQRPYDLVFMDLHMPVMDGLEATAEICARWPASQRPRIVAMTADAMAGDAAKCLQAGMDDYVSKPISIARLEQVLRGTPAGRTLAEPGAAPKADVRPIDAEVLALLREDLGDAVGELVDSFLKEAPTLLSGAEAAAGEGNAEELHRCAHTLKGTAATFGAMALSRLAREVEEQAGLGNVAKAALQLPELRRRWEEARDALVALSGITA